MAVSIDGFKNPCSTSTALETRFAMRCDRAECLTEASNASITDEGDQTKPMRPEMKRLPTNHKKAQNAQIRSENLLCFLCLLWHVLRNLRNLRIGLPRNFPDQLPESFIPPKRRQIGIVLE